MSVRSEVFKLLDQGMESVDIMQKLNIDAQTVAGYKYQWRKEKGIKLDVAKNADELADKIFSDFDKKKEVKAEPPTKKTYVSPATAVKEEAPKSKLKLLTESKTYKGEYGEYTITDGVLTVTLNDKALLLEKPSLEELILELNQLGGMM